MTYQELNCLVAREVMGWESHNHLGLSTWCSPTDPHHIKAVIEPTAERLTNITDGINSWSVPYFNPSRDHNSAALVIDELRKKCYITITDVGDTEWKVLLWIFNPDNSHKTIGGAIDSHIPLTVCLAALQSRGIFLEEAITHYAT